MKKITILILLTLISNISNAKNDTINFNFSNIIDIVETKDHNYIIEYDDPDVFDYTSIAEQNKETIIKDYICIYVNNIDLFNTFLNSYYEYINLKNYKDKAIINKQYKILELNNNYFYLIPV